MSIDRKLLDILACPQDKTPLEMLDKSRLERLNQEITAGHVVDVDKNPVTEPIREALITRDGKRIYVIDDGIPVLLPERAIGTTQLQDFS